MFVCVCRTRIRYNISDYISVCICRTRIRYNISDYISVCVLGPEYGTTEAAWRGCLSEAEDLAEVHTGIKESLVNNVQAQISQWKKENFHKPMVGPCKETKQIEDEFKKVNDH